MNPPPPPGMYGNFGPATNMSGAQEWSHLDNEYNYDDHDHDQDADGNGDDGEGGDSRDAKRRRIARACDMCRKKKIKCDGKMPKCSHCENYKTECIFTHVEKKRAPPKGAKYIEGLENRLGRMESLLRLSGLLAEDDRGRTDLGTLEKRLAERGSLKDAAASPQSQQSPTVNLAHRDGASPGQTEKGQDITKSPETNGNGNGKLAPPETNAAVDGPPKDVDGLADQMCSLITNTAGETRYIGSSSGFSIFSPKGIDWVNAKTGDKSFQKMIAKQGAEEKEGWEHWKPEVFNDLFHRTIFKPLPGRQECQALLKDYFENFNCMFPLFHEPTFMHLVDKHYSLEPYDGAGWWASLNVALAIGHRLRVMSNVVGQEEDEVAWAYLKNAMAVMTELTMRSNDLLSVQALLGMALFLQGTPNPQPSFFLVSAAIRLAHSVGLHKRGSGFNLNAVENEQRKRVFWIAYLLDKDICLRSGRPPAQDDDDMNVELPSENPPDHVGSIPLSDENGSPGTMNLFRLMCQFAQIQSRVYKQLYSVKASQQSDGELLNTIGELDAQLEEWKDSIPVDFRPEHEIKAAHTPLILHVVVLHFAYYNCLTTIHRMSVHHGYWTSRLSDYAIQGLNARPLNPRVFMSAALCVNAARTSIALIRYIPQGDYACVWMILYYPVSALVTLFANILQNPQDARARSDLKLMSSVVSFLTMLERDVSEPNSSVRRMLSVCAEFERIAKVALDKAEREMRGRGKRKQAEKEREKAIKHAVSGEVHLGLEEGKTLEMMQVETQASYRRPVQTPSLRASVAESQAGSMSPKSWVGSPTGGSGTDYVTSNTMPPPRKGHQSSLSPNVQQPAQPAPFNAVPYPMGSNPNNQIPMDYSNGQQHHQQQPPQLQHNQQQQYSPTFSGPPGTAGFGQNSPLAADFSFNPQQTPSNGGIAGATGAFQQPFVPQDLWQMPMTLEWDWAEGLGLGSFAPGMVGGNGGGMGGAGNGGSWEYNLWPPEGGN